jgi:hypothetical protein
LLNPIGGVEARGKKGAEGTNQEEVLTRDWIHYRRRRRDRGAAPAGGATEQH